jgi:hypothetical protein
MWFACRFNALDEAPFQRRMQFRLPRATVYSPRDASGKLPAASAEWNSSIRPTLACWPIAYVH